MGKIKAVFTIFLTTFFVLTGVHNTNAASNKDAALQKMGYSQDEIKKMSQEIKDRIVKTEGTKAKYTVEIKEYYNSADGRKYEITDKNRDIINKIKQRDINEYAIHHGTTKAKLMAASGSGDHQDGKYLQFSAFVDKTPSSSKTEYKYASFVDFQWSSVPFFNFTDHIGLAWDNRFTGIAKTLKGYYHGPIQDLTSKLDFSQSIYGYDVKFPMYGYKVQYGGASQDIVVPVKYKGETGKFQAKYVHGIIPFSGSLSIGPASIDVPSSWMTQEFTLNFNLKIGS